MSFSDDYEFEELDSATLQEVDAIEAAVVEGSSSSVTAPNIATTIGSSIDRAARLEEIEYEIASSKSSASHHSGIFSSLPDHRGQASRTTRGYQPAGSGHKLALDKPIDLTNEDEVATEPESNAPSPQRLGKPANVTSACKPRETHPSDADSFMIDAEEILIFDEDALQQIDRVAAAALSGRPIVPTNKLTRQSTLTGEMLPQRPPKSFTRTKSSNGPQHATAPKAKTWNHQAALSRTIPGRAPSNLRVKGQGEELEGETELPPPPVPGMPSFFQTRAT
jgi:hypothetical protein